ncbi:MAG TPA: VCBS repeat-containing protein [Nannocystis sp.]
MSSQIRPGPTRAHRLRLWVGSLVLASCGGASEVASMQVCDRVGTLCVTGDEHGGLGLSGARGATGDLDGDGVRDLVNVSGSLSIAWGDGDAREYLLFPEGVADAEIGDVDGDGDLDVVFVTTHPASLRVLENQGARRFLERAAVVVPGYGASLWLGQLDGDGPLDAVVASSGNDGALTVFTAGLTRVQPIAVGPGLSAVEVGDLDGDGRLDIVATDDFEMAIRVALADGAGFAAATKISTGRAPAHLQLYDFDGDGRLDVLTQGDSPGIWFHPGDGGGGLAAPRVVVVQESTSRGFAAHRDEQGRRWLITLDNYPLVASQLDDADRVVRRVVAGGHLETYRIAMDGGSLLTQGTFYGQRYSLDPSHVFTELRHGGPGTNRSIALADLDADGEPELLSVEDDVVLRRGLDDESWDEGQPLYAAQGHIYSLVVADVTGDGAPDLVLSGDAPSLQVAVGVGDGTFTAGGAPVQLDGSPGRMYAGLSAPGEAAAVAVAVYDSDDPGVDVLRFDAAGELIDQARVVAADGVVTLTSADLEADGDEDLVVLTRDAHEASSLSLVPRLADGWGPARTRSLADLHSESAPDRPLNGAQLVTGDIDLDDRVDAMLVASGVVVHLLDIGADDPPAPRMREYPGLAAPDALALADVDGEGPLDLVSCSYGGLRILLQASDGEVQPQVAHDQFVRSCALHVDPDDRRATAATATDRGYALLRPDFAPALARTDSFEGGMSFGGRVEAGDIDADGVADIVVADRPWGWGGSTAVLWGSAGGQARRATRQAGMPFRVAELAVAPLDDRPGDEVVMAWTTGNMSIGAGGAVQIWTHAEGSLQQRFTTNPRLGSQVVGVGVQRRAGAPSDVILLDRFAPGELGVIAVPRGDDGDFIADADVLLWSGPWIDDAPAMVIADFDGDGYEDIAVSYGALEGVALTWGDRERTPAVTTVPIPVAARTNLASADLDDDGAAELFVGTEQGVVRIAFAGREPKPREKLLADSAVLNLTITDVDGDGITDIVAHNSWWLSINLRAPTGIYFAKLLFLPLSQLRAADIDGDQILDFIGIFGGEVITRRSTGAPGPPL